MNYNYDVLNYWIDNHDLYINYEIVNKNNGDRANVVKLFDAYDMDCDSESASMEEIDNSLYRLVEKDNGWEFNIPKSSDLSPLLQYLYDSTCESESNMCYIDYDDWNDLKNEVGFNKRDLYYLKKEIKKYNLENYITIDDGEYMICCYGGLQCCFNDDRAFKRGYELER